MSNASPNNARRAADALLLAVKAVEDAVRESGPLGMPEGHLYAALSGFGITLPVFEQLVAALVGAGRIRRDGHLLRQA